MAKAGKLITGGEEEGREGRVKKLKYISTRIQIQSILADFDHDNPPSGEE